MNKSCRPRGAGSWKAHLSEWKSSGLSQEEYCEREGLSAKCFNYQYERSQGKVKKSTFHFIEAKVVRSEASLRAKNTLAEWRYDCPGRRGEYRVVADSFKYRGVTMLKLPKETRIYVASHAVDFRKAINGLAALILEQWDCAPNDGSVYVFYNRDCDRVKSLFWDKNGCVS